MTSKTGKGDKQYKMSPRDVRLVEFILKGEHFVSWSVISAKTYLIRKDRYHEWILIPYDQYTKFAYTNKWIVSVKDEDNSIHRQWQTEYRLTAEGLCAYAEAKGVMVVRQETK